MSESQKFAPLGRPRRVWAVSAVHGDALRLRALHDDIGARFEPGDRLVYLGNLVGRGPTVADAIDELLTFRRAVLALPGVFVNDVVYLRGAQEEMWQKLLQLQFAPNPREVLQWMLDQGADATLAAYGGDAEQGMAAARDGAVALTRWTNALRAAQRAAAGHDSLYSSLRRAAYTCRVDGTPTTLLLVHSGLDATRPLAAQGDSFWWGGAAFNRITDPYDGFSKVIRGIDPARRGVSVTPVTVTLDGGPEGRLVCGCFDPAGELVDLIEV